MTRKFAFLIVILAGQIGAAQTTVQAAKANSTEPGIEKLNLLGADIHMPPFTDTVLGADSEFRRAFYSKGVVLRSNSTVTYSQDVLNSPVQADEQVYMGQRPFGRLMANPMLTYDMRALHLSHAQLFVAAGLNWVSWENAGPSSMTMSALYLYKAFANGRVETKVGYIANDFEFVGLQVGGSLSTGGQGVYAVLPYEVGLSRFPLTAPSFNLRLNGPKNLYFTTAVQRSLDPSGGRGTINRNATGFRFMPKGDKLVNVFEVGYNRRATADSGQTWLRAGYIHNTTPYPNSRTGIPTAGNYCAFILADHEFYQSDREHPGHGIYAGASVMGTAMDLNAYTRYYEFRLYDEGPFRSRPDDTVSLVASYSTYNPWLLKSLVAQGKTVWRNASTLTGSYNMHLSRGLYASAGLSYHAGPDITPRVANGLIFSAIMNVFF
jgi:porin